MVKVCHRTKGWCEKTLLNSIIQSVLDSTVGGLFNDDTHYVLDERLPLLSAALKGADTVEKPLICDLISRVLQCVDDMANGDVGTSKVVLKRIRDLCANWTDLVQLLISSGMKIYEYQTAILNMLNNCYDMELRAIAIAQLLFFLSNIGFNIQQIQFTDMVPITRNRSCQQYKTKCREELDNAKNKQQKLFDFANRMKHMDVSELHHTMTEGASAQHNLFRFACYQNGDTIMHVAVRHNRADMVRYLVLNWSKFEAF